ncbi:hypothetical protein AAZX31_09G103600 [Glycine max]|uniref:Uncharacterized protein n=1 Tax=Glycine max TaxID=3847 RepID=I1L2N0_SOYBN|nr:uncharacterized protein LOC100796667 [Glycine max]KAG5012596.1 hypothetical protein JHK86_024857 [Glycine max]KAH1042525.1 hypothetical protein GYH30_024703 [Glycine max]KAH1233092.1 hypothetical protein GmHk_09G025611 [Glycine max]KRH38124.1 hypothetical protein GLYMA_09G112400v4 [Glycine max]|eukprot:XP_003535127.1 uncharacterized protein LOC100796667 [Glycine max]
MKASLKFREEQQKPLLRAKVPLGILGMPFQSGIVAGESKELTLNLSTFFESGPSLKVAYRPNDSKNPFSFIVKTGTGPFGSPLKSSMLMSCEFNLPGTTGTPLFMLHFKPRFGDFTFKKTQSSIFDGKGFGSFNTQNDAVENGNNAETPLMESAKVSILDSGASMFSGMEVAARTTLPVRGRAAVKFRWGVRIPAEFKGNNAFQKIPFLVMDKIGVEHMMECGDSKKGKGDAGEKPRVPASADVAEACFAVKRQMEVLQAENGLLRNAVEDLRREIVGGRSGGSILGKNPKKNERKTTSDYGNFPGKSTEAEASEELKKALMGAAGGSSA